MNIAYIILLCKLQQGQVSQEKPGSGTGHLEQCFQNLIGKGHEQPKVTLSYLCCAAASRVPSSLYLSLTQHWFRISVFSLFCVKGSSSGNLEVILYRLLSQFLHELSGR